MLVVLRIAEPSAKPEAFSGSADDEPTYYAGESGQNMLVSYKGRIQIPVFEIVSRDVRAVLRGIWERVQIINEDSDRYKCERLRLTLWGRPQPVGEGEDRLYYAHVSAWADCSKSYGESGDRLISDYERLEAEVLPPEQVGEVYLHVGNSGVTFSIQNGRHGPSIEIGSSAFGNMTQTLVVHTTEEGLKALAQLFSIAAERTYHKPYCYPAYPTQGYTRGVDADGKPVLVGVPHPSHEACGVDSNEELDKGNPT